MPATHFGDNSTVVGDNSPPLLQTTKDKDYEPENMTFSTSHKGKVKLEDFITADDYTVEERPFFVRIGKAGLIAALQELDAQLVKVTFP